jgi:protein tyrosine phosphatase (PTP) superfamily phosphohydrolase (DUF442 family)
VPEKWEEYWVAHPVYKNWFITGQITKSHVPVMEGVGFQHFINLRSGIILDGKPSQEEVQNVVAVVVVVDFFVFFYLCPSSPL